LYLPIHQATHASANHVDPSHGAALKRLCTPHDTIPQTNRATKARHKYNEAVGE
jgi:hypothetical protein